MGKKARIASSVIKKMCKNFQETRPLIDKAYRGKCCKENTLVDEIFFINNNTC